MKLKVIAIPKNNYNATFLGYNISINGDSILITTPGNPIQQHFAFTLRTYRESGQKLVTSLLSEDPLIQKYGFSFSMMCYSVPNENIRGLRGLYIVDPLRKQSIGESLLIPLLKIYFILNETVNTTHPNCEIPQLHYALMEHFGFKQADGEKANVMYFPEKKLYYPMNGYRIPYNFYYGLSEICEAQHLATPNRFGKGFPLFVEKQLFKID